MRFDECFMRADETQSAYLLVVSLAVRSHLPVSTDIITVRASVTDRATVCFAQCVYYVSVNSVTDKHTCSVHRIQQF